MRKPFWKALFSAAMTSRFYSTPWRGFGRRFSGSSRIGRSQSQIERAGSRGPTPRARRRCPSGSRLALGPVPRQAGPTGPPKAGLSQLQPPEPRRAGRVRHGLVSSPRRTGQSGGHPRLEQHEVAAPCVDQESNLLSLDGHPHRHKRPDDLQRRDLAFSNRWREGHPPEPIVDPEARARQQVEPDDGVDSDSFQYDKSATPTGTEFECRDPIRNPSTTPLWIRT